MQQKSHKEKKQTEERPLLHQTPNDCSAVLTTSVAIDEEGKMNKSLEITITLKQYNLMNFLTE